MNSTQYIVEAKSGDGDAFDRLYAWLLPRVYRFAVAAVDHESVAEELTSEAFTAMVRRLSEMPDHDAAVLAWLRMVVRNKAVDWIRRQQVSRSVLPKIGASLRSNDRDISGSPETVMVRNELCETVFAAADRLPKGYRDVLYWKYVDNMSLDEIAVVLGNTRSATNSLLYRAREAFRREATLLGCAWPMTTDEHDQGARRQGTNDQGTGDQAVRLES